MGPTLAVKLMLKWPNLYYSTSAFAPRYYPQAIIDYANTRGADKIMYAGYFPMGLTLERIFSELPNVPAQGRRVAEVPARERRPSVRPGGMTMTTVPTTARSPFPVPFGWFRSATRRTSPSASPRRSTTSASTSSPGATKRASSTCRTPFCPHLGAHLGHGGHGRRAASSSAPSTAGQFDAEGVNT